MAEDRRRGAICGTQVCEHGSFRRKCEICERDERIAELERELEEARKALLWYAERDCGVALPEFVVSAYEAAVDAARAAAKGGGDE